MEILAKIAISLVALAQLYTCWIEMFAWETKGRAAFKGALPPEVFTPIKGLAANLGLYNGFLAAGLIWTFFISDPIWRVKIAAFFLGFISIAGIYGSVAGSKKVFFYQALPALIALALVLLS